VTVERLPPLVLHRPTTLPDAVALLSRLPHARPIAGGTDLVPNLRDGLCGADALVDVSAIAGLDGLASDGDGLGIGSGVTIARLVESRALDGPYAAIREAAATIAGPAHRSVATVGGNLCLDTRCVFYNQSAWWRRANANCLKYGGEICHVAPQGKRCHAAFAGDLAPALLALDATVEIAGPAGLRSVALASLYAEDGARHLRLAHDELVAAVRVPTPAPGTRSGYRKSRVRGGIDFPLAGVAVALSVQARAITALRVALTGTNSRPFLVEGTEALVGSAPTDASLHALGKLVQKQASPMRTTATAANYRRQVAAVLAQRLVADLAAA
jgi:4-hydroxybenzoyl-CoA reductase subunit beta